jgi:hypothetical protein
MIFQSSYFNARIANLQTFGQKNNSTKVLTTYIQATYQKQKYILRISQSFPSDILNLLF